MVRPSLVLATLLLRSAVPPQERGDVPVHPLQLCAPIAPTVQGPTVDIGDPVNVS
jgi:hypothetical protein